MLPTNLEELPHLTGNPHRLSVFGHLRPTSSKYRERHRFILLFLERDLTGEGLHRKHCKGKYIGGF